jgi:nitroimidazol reductase NimA-like FMN-containing flavoprotein (pyridoxamine 5'-phosphate oxidase superfamily)
VTQRELEELSPEECFELLARAHVGRLVYHDEIGAVAVPVNYALAGRDLIFRVEGGAKQAAMEEPTLAFEVDHVDEVDRSGWSVLIRGPGSEIEIDRVPGLLHTLQRDFPTPWALGVHNVWLRITPQVVSGRRLGEMKSAPSY